MVHVCFAHSLAVLTALFSVGLVHYFSVFCSPFYTELGRLQWLTCSRSGSWGLSDDLLQLTYEMGRSSYNSLWSRHIRIVTSSLASRGVQSSLYLYLYLLRGKSICICISIQVKFKIGVKILFFFFFLHYTSNLHYVSVSIL